MDNEQGAHLEQEGQPEMLADDAHNLGIAQVSVLVGPGWLRAGW